METFEVEVGEFLVRCFSELENIEYICFKKLNKMIILAFIKDGTPDDLRKVLVTSYEGGLVKGTYEDKETVEKRLAKEAPKESLVDVFFSYYLSLPDTARDKFTEDVIEVFTNIAAEGL